MSFNINIPTITNNFTRVVGRSLYDAIIGNEEEKNNKGAGDYRLNIIPITTTFLSFVVSEYRSDCVATVINVYKTLNPIIIS